MARVRIIEDKDMFHVYIGNCDFWLNRQELLDLYAELLPVVKKGGQDA